MAFKNLPLFILLATTALFGFIRMAPDDPITKAVAQLDKLNSAYPQEKAYLQLDKPYYAVGDDIWFKAYVTVGPDHMLSALSGTINVELIDPRDSVAQALKLPLRGGTAYGDFALSDTLKEGNYRIRAYTEWMRNAGPDYFFDRTISIGNSANNTVFTKTRYSYSSQNGQPAVDAVINFSDLNGASYANREVNFEVQANNRTITKGKEVTDKDGTLHLNFTNVNPAVMNQGKIITRLKVSDKITITKTLPLKAAANKIDVQFFPESGYLVNGLPTKVAFKAVGADGLGKNITGVVVDNANQQVTSFTTQHLGMGMFVLVPEAGKTYRAQVTFEDGSQRTIDLPQARDHGYVLSINSVADPNDIIVRLTASQQLVGSPVELVAQSGGAVRYASKSNMQNPVLSARIPKNKFPSGVAQFTLFSGTGEPLNERVAFISNADQLKIGADIAPTYPAESKVSFQVNAVTPDNKPALSTLSAAVINESKLPSEETDEPSILSYILLSSDLKGYIEKPNYYFVNPDVKKAQADLDILMMTQGYRRFDWKKIINDDFPPVVFQPEKTLQISGHVESGNKPVVHGKVTLLSNKGGVFILDTLTDERGHFQFKDLVFSDSIRFLIQARTAKNGRNVKIVLDNIAPQIVTANPNAPDVEVNVSDKMLPYLKSDHELYDQQMKYGVGNHTIVLNEVTVTEKRKPIVKHSFNLNGAGNADQVIGSDIFERMGCPTLADCLQGRLLGVVFRNGIPYSTRSINSPMLVVVDGVQLWDDNYLNDINPVDIASVEVLRSIGYTSIYGSRGGAGVILINTKRGDDYSPNTAQMFVPGIMTYTPRGYAKVRTFYSPQYDDPKTNKTLANLRTTIYWNPQVITDKDGKASLSYFNTNSPGTYRITIEGIDNDGHIGHQVFRYKVQ